MKKNNNNHRKYDEFSRSANEKCENHEGMPTTTFIKNLSTVVREGKTRGKIDKKARNRAVFGE
jgi:hypothetical protein